MSDKAAADARALAQQVIDVLDGKAGPSELSRVLAERVAAAPWGADSRAGSPSCSEAQEITLDDVAMAVWNEDATASEAHRSMLAYAAYMPKREMVELFKRQLPGEPRSLRALRAPWTDGSWPPDRLGVDGDEEDEA